MSESQKHSTRVITDHRSTATPSLPAVLQDSEARYREFFENANDMLAIFSLDGTIVLVNRAVERLLGWTPQELVGQHYRTVTTPASAARAAERTQRFLAGEKQPALFEAELLGKDGRVVPVEARTRIIRDETGTPVGFQGIYRDISERKVMEAAQQKSEARYRTIFAVSPDFMYVTDATGQLLDANPALLQRTGLSLEQMQQMHVLDFFAGENPEQVHAALSQLNTGQAVQGLEVQARGGDGQVATYEINAILLTDDSEAPQILSLARDITERKRAEQALQENRRLRERIADTIPDILYLYDLTQQALVYVNRQLFTVLGYPPEEYVHKPGPLFCEVVHPDDKERLTERETQLAAAARWHGD